MTDKQIEAIKHFWIRQRPVGWRYVTKTERNGILRIIMRDTTGNNRVLKISPDGITELEGI